MDRIKGILHSKFHIKDLGVLKYFLGLEITYFDEGISLCQRKYYHDLLQDSSLLGSKISSTLWIVLFGFIKTLGPFF